MKKPRVNYGFVREAFYVRRYHAVPYVLKEESVGHHTANVIAILFQLYEGNPPVEVIRAALHHDVPELVTGDVPYTAKVRFPELKDTLSWVEGKVATEQGLDLPEDLPGEHELLLHYADMLDLCCKSVDEMSAGNMLFAPILSRGLSVLRDMLKGPLKDHQVAKELFQMVRDNPFIFVEVVEREENPQTPQTEDSPTKH